MQPGEDPNLFLDGTIFEIAKLMVNGDTKLDSSFNTEWSKTGHRSSESTALAPGRGGDLTIEWIKTMKIYKITWVDVWVNRRAKTTNPHEAKTTYLQNLQVRLKTLDSTEPCEQFSIEDKEDEHAMMVRYACGTQSATGVIIHRMRGTHPIEINNVDLSS